MSFTKKGFITLFFHFLIWKFDYKPNKNLMESGQYFHVYNRGNNKEKIFFEECNYVYFLKKFDEYLSPFVEVISYCLMPNHFHFFIRIKEFEEELQLKNSKSPIKGVRKAFKDFFISYSKSVNKKYDRTGTLFQAKFKKKAIDNESDFCGIIQYIHFNPVKAGLCKNCGDWKYSSYNAFICNKHSKINVAEILKWFGGREEYIGAHDERRIDFEKFRDLE